MRSERTLRQLLLGSLRRSYSTWKMIMRCWLSAVAVAISCSTVPEGPHASLPSQLVVSVFHRPNAPPLQP